MTRTCDVAIVGGGLMGCSLALRLARRGVRALVLERAIPGAEASSAAAGILGPQAEAESPGPLLELGLRSRAMWPAFADEVRELSGLDVGYLRCGVLEAAFGEAEERAFAERAAWQRARGLRAEMVDARAARELEPALSPEVRAGLHLPDEGQVDTAVVARAVSAAAARAGAEIASGAVVRRVRIENGRAVGVDLDDGEVRAAHTVVAAGAWSSLVEGAGMAPNAVRPQRGQIAQLEVRPPPLTRIVFGPGGYLVPRPDGRIIAGSTMELVGFRKEVTVGGLLHVLGVARRLAPALADAPVTATWAGFRPLSADARPIIGPAPVPGLWLCTGHHRNGILLSPVTAKILADLIVEGKTDFDVASFLPRPLG